MTAFVVVVVLVVAYLWSHHHKAVTPHQPGAQRRVRRATAAPAGGWVYFACGRHGPVKVGTSSKEPAGSVVDAAEPMRVVHKIRTTDAEGDVRQIVKELEPYHLRQGWFDRDATLYYVDHLKGAA
jgi:hypothetical protein